jgi:hypothetical protein
MKKVPLSSLVLATLFLAAPLAQAQAAGDKQPISEVERVCAPHPEWAAHQARIAEELAKHLRLNDAQKAAFKDFQDARAKSIEAANAHLCANKPDIATFEGRLKFHQTFLEDRLDAVKLENPKLIAFYNSLDAEQKVRFDKMRARLDRRQDR